MGHFCWACLWLANHYPSPIRIGFVAFSWFDGSAVCIVKVIGNGDVSPPFFFFGKKSTTHAHTYTFLRGRNNFKKMEYKRINLLLIQRVLGYSYNTRIVGFSLLYFGLFSLVFFSVWSSFLVARRRRRCCLRLVKQTDCTIMAVVYIEFESAVFSDSESVPICRPPWYHDTESNESFSGGLSIPLGSLKERNKKHATQENRRKKSIK